MQKIFIISFILLTSNLSIAKKICKPPIIKSENEIKEKLKICNKGDKLLLYFDIKVREEELIVKLCNLKHTIITKDEVKIIHKRGSGLTLICIYDPN